MTNADQLWGGRFTEKPHETFAEFNDSFRFDRRLFAADIRGSVAHANGLLRAGLLSPDEADAVIGGLTQLLADAAIVPDFFASDAEDVHSFIEGKLVEAIGDAGRKLHTGRSRNDQVATALRIWMREEIDRIDVLTRDLQAAIVDIAEGFRDAVMPGYTHLQRAQPILFAHWCLAYFEMFRRDRDRLKDLFVRVNVLPLGSGALAGTGFPIDREAVASELGFSAVAANSLDAVSDRDFAIEFTSVCSLIMLHLSRIAEDMIIFCSNEFGFIKLSDAVSSGSSLMPQKKNPDALELLRGKAGRVFGHNSALLTMMKGLPLAYNKDMQEDKEAVFDTADTVKISLRAAAIVVENAIVDEERSREAAIKGYLNATELADHLVKKGVPFRTAHETVGRIVLLGIGQGKELEELTLEEMRAIAPEIDDGVFQALTLDRTIGSKSAIGGTSPVRVAAALQAAREYLNG
ncbi:MAG TPA: argininosuccinate lyase [Pyrinomonadaceae bacterium]|nr:argininosuccinate lyase [Chloracidobacterium sp.]HRJ89751.1 argininosuccinate lyase [Pyrinomonadaceae bacterium]HRK49680.1 argininosuccinate lyase [Pyrinomonadaceae bacterium]